MADLRPAANELAVSAVGFLELTTVNILIQSKRLVDAPEQDRGEFGPR